MSEMILEVIDIKENNDGSATITVDMDQETLKIFAGIGIVKALKDSAEDINKINAKDIIKDSAEDITDTQIQNLYEVKDKLLESIPDIVVQYLDDAIKVLENRQDKFLLSDNDKLIIDTLSETCQNTLEILIVARSFFDNIKT